MKENLKEYLFVMSVTVIFTTVVYAAAKFEEKIRKKFEY